MHLFCVLFSCEFCDALRFFFFLCLKATLCSVENNSNI